MCLTSSEVNRDSGYNSQFQLAHLLVFLLVKYSFNASALSPSSVTSVPTRSCNAAASSIASHLLSQEQQKPFQPSGISAHHLKLLSCCSSRIFSEFISMQMTAFC